MNPQDSTESTGAAKSIHEKRKTKTRPPILNHTNEGKISGVRQAGKAPRFETLRRQRQVSQTLGFVPRKIEKISRDKGSKRVKKKKKEMNQVFSQERLLELNATTGSVDKSALPSTLAATGGGGSEASSSDRQDTSMSDISSETDKGESNDEEEPAGSENSSQTVDTTAATWKGDRGAAPKRSSDNLQTYLQNPSRPSVSPLDSPRCQFDGYLFDWQGRPTRFHMSQVGEFPFYTPTVELEIEESDEDADIKDE